MSFFRSARSLFGSNAPKPTDQKSLIPQDMLVTHEHLDIQSIMNEINTGQLSPPTNDHSSGGSLSPISASAGAQLSYSDVRNYMPQGNLQVDQKQQQPRRSTNGETINPELAHQPPEL